MHALRRASYAPVDVAPPSPFVVQLMRTALKESRQIAVVAGAGMSTESGIPDYRGPFGSYKQGHKPMTYQFFMESHKNRQRYWTRNMTGYRLMDSREPNEGHRLLASLQKVIRAPIITQNVDGLQIKAGSTDVVELHGSAHRVVCTKCWMASPREDFQRLLETLNPNVLPIYLEKMKRLAIEGGEGGMRADGDAHLTADDIDFSALEVPTCPSCGPEGVMKPDVVFFGENTKTDDVNRCYQWVKEADSVWVFGTSLEVFSSYRFIKRAHEWGKPVIIVNVGTTRGDPLATLRVTSTVTDALKAIVRV